MSHAWKADRYIDVVNAQMWNMSQQYHSRHIGRSLNNHETTIQTRFSSFWRKETLSAWQQLHATRITSWDMTRRRHSGCYDVDGSVSFTWYLSDWNTKNGCNFLTLCQVTEYNAGTRIKTILHIALRFVNRACFHGEEVGTNFGRSNNIQGGPKKPDHFFEVHNFFI